MNHEFWNEIGNLYFMHGAYEPAIHAYLRAIKTENTFGRAYTNLAMAYVQTGRYSDAIKLYRRSIELLADKKEKAAAWDRLGILYRQIKKYDNALEAYQRADLILPRDEDSVAVISPLTLSRPEIDLESILAKGGAASLATGIDLAMEVNSEFEMAESQHEDSFESMAVPVEFESFSQTEDPAFEPPVETQSEWKLAYSEETLQSEPVEEAEIIVPIEVQKAVEEACGQEAPRLDSNVEESGAPAFQNENPLNDLSPNERQMLTLEIIKYQQLTSQNPRSYILWESLGEAYKSAGQYRDAIQAFQKAITLHPANQNCHYLLGLVYGAERKDQEAVKCFKKVLELDPNSAQAHASLASQYRKMGLEGAAQSHIEKARALQPEDESDYNNACLEAICGNNERALELLEIALQSRQTYITWAKTDPDFDALRGDQRFQTLLATHTAVAV
ncbi:MAG: tetratricopeptide repeat protein [Chloroflexi bacterium]|nr:tetratricopeptide repeat protein [Chloroflexota bacterium]